MVWEDHADLHKNQWLCTVDFTLSKIRGKRLLFIAKSLSVLPPSAQISVCRSYDWGNIQQAAESSCKDVSCTHWQCCWQPQRIDGPSSSVTRQAAAVHPKQYGLTGKACSALPFLTAVTMLISWTTDSVDCKWSIVTKLFKNWLLLSNTKWTRRSYIAVTVTYGRINPFFGPAVEFVLRFNVEYTIQS